MLPDAIKNLADQLAELPSIGPRQAIRLAFYLVNRGQEEIKQLAQSIDDLRKIKICENCFFPHQNPSTRASTELSRKSSGQALCDICKNPSRRKDIVAIVEKETDLISIENTKKFVGRYLVLGAISKTGSLEPWQKLRLENLKSFIKKSPSAGGLGGSATEIILAFNPSREGDFHASLVGKELESFAKKISRLGRGLPTGGEIEFADDETLGSALERRN